MSAIDNLIIKYNSKVLQITTSVLFIVAGIFQIIYEVPSIAYYKEKLQDHIRESGYYSGYYNFYDEWISQDKTMIAKTYIAIVAGVIIIGVGVLLFTRVSEKYRKSITIALAASLIVPNFLLICAYEFAFTELIISIIAAVSLIVFVFNYDNIKKNDKLLCIVPILTIFIGLITIVAREYHYISMSIIYMIAFLLGLTTYMLYVKHDEMIDNIYNINHKQEEEKKMRLLLANKKVELKEKLRKKYESEWNELYALSPGIRLNESNYVQKTEDANLGFLIQWLSFDEGNLYISDNLPSATDAIVQAVDKMNSIEEIDEYLMRASSQNFISYSRIPFEKIIYYNDKGELHKEQYVTSSGGGVNLGGAIVGGILFGDAGAIVGGRAENKVSTVYKTSDNRYILLKYYDGAGKIITKNYHLRRRMFWCRLYQKKNTH